MACLSRSFQFFYNLAGGANGTGILSSFFVNVQCTLKEQKTFVWCAIIGSNNNSNHALKHQTVLLTFITLDDASGRLEVLNSKYWSTIAIHKIIIIIMTDRFRTGDYFIYLAAVIIITKSVLSLLLSQCYPHYLALYLPDC